jgi:hypothetical protein
MSAGPRALAASTLIMMTVSPWRKRPEPARRNAVARRFRPA